MPYDGERLLSTALFGTLFFVVFMALPPARARLGRRLHPSEIGVLALALGFYVLLLQQLLYDEHRWWLTGAVLVLAALDLA